MRAIQAMQFIFSSPPSKQSAAGNKITGIKKGTKNGSDEKELFEDKGEFKDAEWTAGFAINETTARIHLARLQVVHLWLKHSGSTQASYEELLAATGGRGLGVMTAWLFVWKRQWWLS